jgi:hypothetical protein
MVILRESLIELDFFAAELLTGFAAVAAGGVIVVDFLVVGAGVKLRGSRVNLTPGAQFR